MRRLRLKNCGRVKALHFAPAGRLLVLGGVEAFGIDAAVSVDLATGEPGRTSKFLAERAAFARGQTHFALATETYSRSEDARLVRWCDPAADPADWQTLPVGVARQRGTVAIAAWAVAVAPDARRLLVSIGRQRVAPGTPSATWTDHLADCPLDPPGKPTVTDLPAQVLALAFAPDGTRWAAVTTIDGRPALGVYDRAGGPPLAQIRSPSRTSSFGSPQISPDGRFLAAAHARSVHVLTADRLSPVAVLDGHPKQVTGFTFMSDGRLLTACQDGQVRTWDPATGTAGPAYDWQIGAATALGVAPDGLTCAAGGLKGQVVIWDAGG